SGGVPQVWTHPNLGHGNLNAAQRRIAEFTAAEDPDQRMPHLLPDPQLSLARVSPTPGSAHPVLVRPPLRLARRSGAAAAWASAAVPPVGWPRRPVRISSEYPRFGQRVRGPPPARGTSRSGLTQVAGDLFHLVALDHVALLDVLIVLEGHATLVALPHLADLVLEALEGLQGTLVDDDVVPQQADLGAALDDAFGHHAA